MAKILLDFTDDAYRITLNAPPLNILDIPLLEELRQVLREIRNDRALLIIAAAGEKAFSAGVSVQDHVGDKIRPMLTAFHDCFRILNRLELVTVSIVQGVALGGGCELALACDFVLASDRARFGLPEINLGVFPPVAAYQMSRQVFPRRGLEMLLTGDSVDAQTGFSIGLVNAVFPSAELEQGAQVWMTKLTRQSASSLRFAKRAFRLAAADEFEKKLGAVEKLYLGELMSTEDANEGLTAFMEKRPAIWKGQ